MSRAPGILAAALVSIIASGPLCAAGAADGAGGTRRPLRVTIAFTGDASGYLEPCG